MSTAIHFSGDRMTQTAEFPASPVTMYNTRLMPCIARYGEAGFCVFRNAESPFVEASHPPYLASTRIPASAANRQALPYLDHWLPNERGGQLQGRRDAPGSRLSGNRS